MKDVAAVTLRPSEVGDLEPTWDMFSILSEETLEFQPIPFDRERVEGWFKNIDYEQHLPILGFVDEKGEIRVITSSTLGFHSLELYHHGAKFGISIHADYQNRGLGTALTQYMINIAREWGIQKVDLMVVCPTTRRL